MSPNFSVVPVENFNSKVNQEEKWVINMEGMILEIPSVILLHTHIGMVQCKTSQGMEAHLLCDSDECDTGISSSNRSSMGDDVQSMVEFPFRHLGARRRENTRMENYSPNLFNSDVMRSQPNRETDNKKNVGKSSNCNHVLRQLACNKNPASVLIGNGV